MKNAIILTLILTLGTTLSTASAETLAKWDLTVEDGTQLDALPIEGSVVSGLQVSPIARGNGLSFTETTKFTADGFASSSTPQTQTIADAIENETFFEVTLTPEKGKTLDLNYISFASKRASKNSGPNFLIVRTSLDDFTNDVTAPTKTQPVDIPGSCDIELWFFDGILSGITESITLRFYGFGRNQSHNPDGGLWVISNNTETSAFSIHGTLSPD